MICSYQQGILKLYNDNTLLGTYDNTQKLILPYLTSNNYILRTELTYNNITVSSNILSVNINPGLQILTISDALYSSSNISLNISSNYNYILNKTSFWNKINNNKLIGSVKIIRIIDENTMTDIIF